MIFAEVGAAPADDLVLRVEYDGAIAAGGSAADAKPPRFSVSSGTARATERMEELLRRDHDSNSTLKTALRVALDAWSVGSMTADEESAGGLPSPEALRQRRVAEFKGEPIEEGLRGRSSTCALV